MAESPIDVISPNECKRGKRDSVSWFENEEPEPDERDEPEDGHGDQNHAEEESSNQQSASAPIER